MKWSPIKEALKFLNKFSLSVPLGMYGEQYQEQ